MGCLGKADILPTTTSATIMEYLGWKRPQGSSSFNPPAAGRAADLLTAVVTCLKTRCMQPSKETGKN